MFAFDKFSGLPCKGRCRCDVISNAENKAINFPVKVVILNKLQQKLLFCGQFRCLAIRKNIGFAKQEKVILATCKTPYFYLFFRLIPCFTKCINLCSLQNIQNNNKLVNLDKICSLSYVNNKNKLGIRISDNCLCTAKKYILMIKSPGNKLKTSNALLIDLKLF